MRVADWHGAVTTINAPPTTDTHAGGSACPDMASRKEQGSSSTPRDEVIKQLDDAVKASRGGFRLIVNSTVCNTVRLCGTMSNKARDGDVIWVPEIDAIPEGSYVVATGRMIRQNRHWELDAYRTERVVDFNVIHMYFLTVIHDHVASARQEQQEKAKAAAEARAAVRDKIVGVLMDPRARDNEAGVSVDYLSFYADVEESTVRDVLHEVAQVGLVISTIDISHYRWVA
ncbi:hypothetical protein ACP70R_009417 [Stipagrostis hirtigluma subsp. patula]